MGLYISNDDKSRITWQYCVNYVDDSCYIVKANQSEGKFAMISKTGPGNSGLDSDIGEHKSAGGQFHV